MEAPIKLGMWAYMRGGRWRRESAAMQIHFSIYFFLQSHERYTGKSGWMIGSLFMALILFSFSCQLCSTFTCTNQNLINNHMVLY